MVPKFDTLPNEIQHMVFHILRVNPSDMCEYVLVCTSWKVIWQPLLYQRVDLKNGVKLFQLVRSLENQEHLGSLIHQLKFNFQVHQSDSEKNKNVAALFTYLSKLENIDCTSGGFYVRLAEALSLNRLPCLKYLSPPKKSIEAKHYAICALLLRDRLANLNITVTMDKEEQTSLGLGALNLSMKDSIRFQLLYNEITQFKDLTSLYLERGAINIIDLLEDVTTKCPSLRRLTIDIEPNREPTTHRIIIESTYTSGFIPANNIDYLHIRRSIIQDPQVVLYILYKFPQVKSFALVRQCIPTLDLNKFTMNKFMEYLSQLRYADIKSIPWKKMDTMNYIGSFWKAISQTRAINVHFRYNHQATPASRISIEMNHGQCTNTIYYHESDQSDEGLEHRCIFKERGELFRTLKLEGIISGIFTSSYASIDILILQTFLYCKNLKSLWMIDCHLSSVGRPSFISFKNHRLQHLRIANCVFGDNDVYEKVSQMIANLRYLEIASNEYSSDPNDKCAALKNINLSATHVILLSLSKNGEHQCGEECCKERVILLKVTAEMHTSYYMYDFDAKDDLLFEPIQKDDFDHFNSVLSNVLNIGVRCKTLRRVEVIHAGQKVKLNKVLVD